MTRSSLLTTSAIRAAVAFSVAAAIAAPSYAQVAPPSDEVPGQSESEIESGTNAQPEGDGTSTITVTGSRIRRPNLEAAVPITSVGGEEFFQQGQANIGETLTELPQLRNTFGQQNVGAGVGVAGLNLLDLRGLGTVRTLVLVNGRRHVAADILSNASSPDVNTIPNDLIERVDIVTGGNSAVYGSDAIAGVVNFVLRRNFEGFQIRGLAGVSDEGFGANQYASAMYGMNFAGGRGNITLHGEYARQERVYASDIPFLRRQDALVTVDADSAGLPSASDGIPDNLLFRDVRTAQNHRFGLVAIPQQNATGACGRGTLANDGPANNLGTAYHCNFIFNDIGRLVPQTGTRVGTGPAGTFIGGNGQSGREGTLLSILPRMERWNANLLAHHEVSEALVLFAEAKAVRINTVGNQLGPTFVNNNSAGFNDARTNPRLDNPFLNPADRATISNGILAANCGFAFGGTIATPCVTLTAAQRASVLDGSYRFLFARTLTDLGTNRDEFFRRDTYRAVVGARGTFNEDWSYELSANYGKFKERDELRGFVDRQRFLLSLDAGRNPTTGQIQCRSQFDPASATAATGNGNTGAAARLAADIAACVPYNPFGVSDNSAAAAYFTAPPVINRSSISQLNFLGFVSGDLSQLFELPGGPIAFVLGGEYRREKAFNDSSEFADNGQTNAVFLGDVNAPAVKVKEAFGELQFPILRELPFFNELTISVAGRVSDYNTAVGTTLAYNAGIEWSPVRDLRFRANYGRSVRAPNVTESGFPSVPNFANNFTDPCSANAIGNNPNRQPNCSAQLSPAQLAALPTVPYSIGIISGSNPDLTEEKADSYTIGAVLTPRFLPGFSLSADYYDITVKDVIVTLAAQAIVNACYDQPGGGNPLCNAFQRNLTSGTGPNGEVPGQILNNSLVAGPQNFARRVRRGLDIEAAYRTNLTADLRLNARVIYAHQFQNSNFQDPARPTFENRLLSEVGDPEDEVRFDLDLTFDRFTFGYGLRYLGKQIFNTTYENYFPLNDEAALNADFADIKFYPAVTYHDIRFDWRVSGEEGNRNELNFYFGVDNVLDRKPPLGTTATNTGGINSSIFSIRGRQIYGGFRARF